MKAQKPSMQLTLIAEQRTMKYLGSIRSQIRLEDQITGTMFEPAHSPEPELFQPKLDDEVPQ